MSKLSVPFDPFLDHSLGRWLATRVGWFARRWQERTQQALVSQALREFEEAKETLCIRANLLVEELVDYSELVSAVCHYRNAMVRVELLVNGEKAARELFMSFEREGGED